MLQKLPPPKTKFGIQTFEEYYNQIRNKCEEIVLHNVEVTLVRKTSKSLDVSKAFGIDQISSKFLLDGALVICIHLAKTINLLTKRNLFLSQNKV